MKRKTPQHLLLVALLAVLTFTRCGLKTPQTDEMNPVLPASMFVEHDGSFCDGSAKDKFAVGYFGTDPLDTLVYLYIVCHQKDTVYRAQFPGEWFLESDDTSSDSAQVAHVQSKMRALAEGRLMPPKDSFDVAAAGKQPLFGIDLHGHLQSILYFSPDDHKVHALEQAAESL